LDYAKNKKVKSFDAPYRRVKLIKSFCSLSKINRQLSSLESEFNSITKQKQRTQFITIEAAAAKITNNFTSQHDANINLILTRGAQSVITNRGIGRKEDPLSLKKNEPVASQNKNLKKNTWL